MRMIFAPSGKISWTE